MCTITFIEHDQTGGQEIRRTGVLRQGQNVWALGVELELLSQSACGGRGICGKCRLQVVGASPTPSDADHRVFSTQELQVGWRLACRLYPTSDLTLRLPPPERGLQVAVSGRSRPVTLAPATRKVCLTLPRPTLEDQRADWPRLTESLQALGIPADGGDLAVWQALPSALRQGDFRATVALHGA